MISPEEKRVVNILLTRRENYGLGYIGHRAGRYYDVALNGRDYIAVVLPSSFQFYELRYHLAEIQPDLCIGIKHDTVLPIPCLYMESSNMCEPYALPEKITDLTRQRWSKAGFQCLLGLYLLGVHRWVDFVEALPATTRKRYLRRAKELEKRSVKGGRPVGLDQARSSKQH